MVFLEYIFDNRDLGMRVPFTYKNLESIGVHDGMGDRSPNQLLANLTAH